MNMVPTESHIFVEASRILGGIGVLNPLSFGWKDGANNPRVIIRVKGVKAQPCWWCKVTVD
jgi:hypothetical protein